MKESPARHYHDRKWRRAMSQIFLPFFVHAQIPNNVHHSGATRYPFSTESKMQLYNCSRDSLLGPQGFEPWTNGFLLPHAGAAPQESQDLASEGLGTPDGRFNKRTAKAHNPFRLNPPVSTSFQGMRRGASSARSRPTFWRTKQW